MLITIYNKYFKRVNILRKYIFAQYTDRFRDIGEFTIYAVLCEENMYLFEKVPYYVCFSQVEKGVEQQFFGKIDYVRKDGDSEYQKTITVIGRSISFILDRRVVYGQQNYRGTPEQNIKKIMDDNIRVSGERFLNIVTSYGNNLTRETNFEELQQTGGTVFAVIQAIMEQHHMGYDMKPVITGVHILPGTVEETNISEWTFEIMDGHDRTYTNKEGNLPVIFAQSYNNLRRSVYERDTMNFCNVAYVAGEGEGTTRVWKEVLGPQITNKTDYDNSGWYRFEIFVDARDLQSETEQGTLTPQQYGNVLNSRGLNNLADYQEIETYEATIVNNDSRYVYGRDFYKGDYVTIRDNEIGVSVDAQITETTFSVEKSNKTFDILFGNKAITVVEKLRKKGAI